MTRHRGEEKQKSKTEKKRKRNNILFSFFCFI